MAGLKLAAAHAKIRTEKRREEERLGEEARERGRLREELCAEELDKFEEREGQASDWHRARVSRDYIDAMEATLDAGLPEEELARRQAYIALGQGEDRLARSAGGQRGSNPGKTGAGGVVSNLGLHKGQECDDDLR